MNAMKYMENYYQNILMIKKLNSIQLTKKEYHHDKKY